MYYICFSCEHWRFTTAGNLLQVAIQCVCVCRIFFSVTQSHRFVPFCFVYFFFSFLSLSKSSDLALTFWLIIFHLYICAVICSSSLLYFLFRQGLVELLFCSYMCMLYVCTNATHLCIPLSVNFFPFFSFIFAWSVFNRAHLISWMDIRWSVISYTFSRFFFPIVSKISFISFQVAACQR